MNWDKRERIKGALIGAAYGDAFGMPSEMWPPEKIRESFGEIATFLPGREEHEISRGFRAGEVTDDTMNLALVAEMLWENGGRVSPELFVQKLRAWAEKCGKSKKVIGPSTAAAFARLDEGVPMELTGKSGTTNGGAMKILPVGLVNADGSLEELVGQVHLLCLPTHNTSTAISGACAVAAAGACAVKGERDIKKILEYAAEAAKAGETRGFLVSAPSVPARIRLAEEIVERAESMKEAAQAMYRLIGTGLPAAECVPTALGLFYLAGGEPCLCARLSANIGGDTDTIGAIACGICGAYKGAGAFPEEEIRLLERVNGLDFEKMADRTAAVFRQGTG